MILQVCENRQPTVQIDAKVALFRALVGHIHGESGIKAVTRVVAFLNARAPTQQGTSIPMNTIHHIHRKFEVP